jgi:hypothetical protein
MQEKCYTFLLQDNMIYKINILIIFTAWVFIFYNVEERTLKYVPFHGMSLSISNVKTNMYVNGMYNINYFCVQK